MSLSRRIQRKEGYTHKEYLITLQRKIMREMNRKMHKVFWISKVILSLQDFQFNISERLSGPHWKADIPGQA